MSRSEGRRGRDRESPDARHGDSRFAADESEPRADSSERADVTSEASELTCGYSVGSAELSERELRSAPRVNGDSGERPGAPKTADTAGDDPSERAETEARRMVGGGAADDSYSALSGVRKGAARDMKRMEDLRKRIERAIADLASYTRDGHGTPEEFSKDSEDFAAEIYGGGI